MKNGNVTIVNKELEKVQRDLNVNVLFFSFPLRWLCLAKPWLI